jgi:thymidylate synthase (FAD)
MAMSQPTIEARVPNSEALVAYCARVSNPSNQDKFDTAEGLLEYCIKNKHWSIFQMVNALVEIEGPRDITRQFTRHSSLYCFGDPFDTPGFNYDQGGVQEFSQRYSDEIEFTEREFRSQDTKNRQNSVDDLDLGIKQYFEQGASNLVNHIEEAYAYMRAEGVAKECARVILPEGLTMSRLYVNGTLRSWLHYLEVRDDPGVTQWEHVMLARKIKDVLVPAFPTVFNLTGNA